MRLPSRRVFAVLVLAFLGFGVLLGNVASSRVDYSLASAHPPLKLILPAASAATSTSTADAGEDTTEPPEAAVEPTPEASAADEAAGTPAAAPRFASTTPADGGSAKQKSSEPASAPGAAAAKLPAIRHVFVIMLSDEPYASVFGPLSSAPYLARTLEKRGELLARYYGVAHEQLANGIALLSGQGPTPATAANCPTYNDITPATAGGEGQTLGEGCVYPATTPTLPGQLEAKHHSWRAYVQGIGEPGGAVAPCAHPSVGQSDPTSVSPATPAGTPAPAGPFATFRNPFVYFHSLIDSPECAKDDIGLSALGGDLKSSQRTPSLSYIVPDRCHDGSPGPCPGGGAGGLPAADGWLKEVVPKILAAPA
ncbi:MAG TPA: hypothetical protein VGF47_12610, partial [Solirubrobacteraceae bacterium]